MHNALLAKQKTPSKVFALHCICRGNYDLFALVYIVIIDLTLLFVGRDIEFVITVSEHKWGTEGECLTQFAPGGGTSTPCHVFPYICANTRRSVSRSEQTLH